MSKRVRKVFSNPVRYERMGPGGWEPITEEAFHELMPKKDIDYAAGEMPGVHGDYTDWCRENGGRGRYCPQAARHPGDERAYFPDRKTLIDWGKNKGYGVEVD